MNDFDANKKGVNRLSISRRKVLQAGLASSAAALSACSPQYQSQDNWWHGQIAHLLPLVSHQSFNIKVSFSQALTSAPLLKIDQQRVKAQQTDTAGRFWQFLVNGLLPDTTYQMQLLDQRNKALCDSWPLATFPAPSMSPEHCRVISYTCAGGPDLPILPGGKDVFKPVAYRQKLLDLILQQSPDLVIANGDHIYWDYRSWVSNLEGKLSRKAMSWYLNTYGGFDESKKVLGSANEATLIAVADEQIVGMYGVKFRSTPIYFVTDDHDYFDNDDATPELVTFPPKAFNQDLRNTLQRLYFPEYIVEEAMPAQFPGLSAKQDVSLSSHFGACQYGDLFAGVFYDCGGLMSLGDSAALVPAAVEAWLLQKTAEQNSLYFAHVPSHPMGWTAGKWREWYPDLLSSTGTTLAPVGTDENGAKYLWQSGWWQQHQRLLSALVEQKSRKPLLVSGDLHALAAGKILASGELNFQNNPVYSILSGPVGVGGLGWLSRARGVTAKVPEQLNVHEILAPQERNGFTAMDITRQRNRVELYICPEGYVDPENLSVEIKAQFDVPVA